MHSTSKRLAVAMLGTVLGTTAIASGQITERHWQGPTSDAAAGGVITWEDAAHWGGDVPDTRGANGERAIIDDIITGDRTIQTSGPLDVSLITWNYNTGSTGVNTFKLGGDLTVHDGSSTASATARKRFRVTNDSGNAEKMVVDLNGHTLEIWAQGADTTDNEMLVHDPVTLMTSASGGSYAMRSVGRMHEDVVVGSGVTFRTFHAGGHSWFRGDWASDSTLHVTTTGPTTLRSLPGGGVGDFIVGDPSLADPAEVLMFLGSNGIARVQGSLTMLNSSDGDAVEWTWRGDSEVWIGGDLIDHALASAGDYGRHDDGGNGTFVFYNDPADPQQLSIARNGLTANFRVGNLSSDGDGTDSSTGHAQLVADLVTSGTFTVRGGATLDVVDHHLSTGAFSVGNGASIAYALGAEPGAISVTDLEFGEDFILSLAIGEGWQNGEDLILFSHDTLTNGLTEDGVPTIQAPAQLTYDQFLTDGGTVRLTNVVIPEPASSMLLGMGAAVLLLRRRHAVR